MRFDLAEKFILFNFSGRDLRLAQGDVFWFNLEFEFVVI